MLLNPFLNNQATTIYKLPKERPIWNWGAFLIPEFWFLYHEIWGPFLIITFFYSGLVIASFYEYFYPFGKDMLIVLLVHLIAGRYGNNIYYLVLERKPLDLKKSLEA
jgi:hypothetical protein